MVNTFTPKTSKPAKGSVTYAKTYSLFGKEYAINTWDGEYGIREDILHPMIHQMEAMLSYHSKVYQVRLESHDKRYSGDNRAFTHRLRVLIKRLKGRGDLRIAYCWVREKDRSKHYHYHLVLWVNGQKTNSAWAIQTHWEEIHQETGASAPHRPRKPTPMIHRSQPETQSGAIYTASYMAKERTKGYGDKGTRDFSTSQLKHNSKNLETNYVYAKKIA